MPTAPGPRANKVCVGGIRAGGVAPCATGGGVYHPKPWRRVIRVTSNPATVIPVLDTGIQVIDVCGQTPAVLFYLLDRHASLAMTKGTKCSNTHHSCHSRAGGNRAWVVINYLIGGIILCCVFIIAKPAIRI